jgi:hypothetical protein
MNVRVGTKGRYIMVQRLHARDYPRRYEAQEHELRCGLIRRLDRAELRADSVPTRSRHQQYSELRGQADRIESVRTQGSWPSKVVAKPVADEFYRVRRPGTSTEVPLLWRQTVVCYEQVRRIVFFCAVDGSTGGLPRTLDRSAGPSGKHRSRALSSTAV